MKRITLLMVAFLGSIALQAQTAIFEQLADHGSGGTSELYAISGTATVMADDFVLSNSTDISSMTFYGFQPEGNLASLVQGFALFIYADSAGMPAGDPFTADSELYVFDIQVADVGLNNGDFTIDIKAANGGTALNLAAGTYWVVAMPILNLDAATAATNDRWYWAFSLTNNSNEAVATTATGWEITSVAYSDATITSLAFTVYDDNMAVAGNVLPQISLYPNPVQNQLNIKVPNTVEINSAVMFDLLGQQTVMNIGENNTLNTSNLASGVYILKLETNQGTMTKKVIKQ